MSRCTKTPGCAWEPGHPGQCDTARAVVRRLGSALVDWIARKAIAALGGKP